MKPLLARSTWFGATLATAIGLAGLVTPPMQAARLADGRVYFDRPPSLVDSSTTRNRTSTWGATYYFTVEVPDSAGEPLQRLAVAQRDGDSSARRVAFDLGETRAFIGTRNDRGDAVPLAGVTWDDETKTVVVMLAQPAAPGTTITIGLRPERNPRLGGVYLFGVTAFPAGDQGQGQFLGFGRFHFYEGNDRLPLSRNDGFWWQR